MKRNADVDVEADLFHRVRYFESATECAKTELESLVECLMQAWLASMHDDVKRRLVHALQHCIGAHQYLSGPSGADAVAVARAVERLREAVGVNERK